MICFFRLWCSACLSLGHTVAGRVSSTATGACRPAVDILETLSCWHSGRSRSCAARSSCSPSRQPRRPRFKSTAISRPPSRSTPMVSTSFRSCPMAAAGYGSMAPSSSTTREHIRSDLWRVIPIPLTLGTHALDLQLVECRFLPPCQTARASRLWVANLAARLRRPPRSHRFADPAVWHRTCSRRRITTRGGRCDRCACSSLTIRCPADAC